MGEEDQKTHIKMGERERERNLIVKKKEGSN